jgi:histidinol-phosphatase (PHP family)
MYKTDYHIHSKYSDGKSNLMDYVLSAQKLGFNEIGFSEHISFDNPTGSSSIEYDDINKYIYEINKLKTQFSKIKIRIGFEVNYTLNSERKIKEFFEDLPVDYLIGSVHNLPYGPIDSTPKLYENGDIFKIWHDYFALVEKAVESELFNIIGHIDLVRVFGFKPVFDVTHLYKSIAQKLKRENVAIEINTNGKNKYLNNFYPDPNYLKIFYNQGVSVCVNSDAHNPNQIGQFFDQAYSLLKNIGYTNMVTFKNRKKNYVKLR